VARIVAVHGIGQQYKGEESLHTEWLPALRDGLHRAGIDELAPGDLRCAFYGDLFRPKGKGREPRYDATDVDPNWEAPLLDELWAEAARVDPAVAGPQDSTKARTPRTIQAALRALSGSRFFVGLVEHLLIADLKQVRAYLHDPERRAQIRERVSAEISADTTVLVGHSLGSVVAYEVCAAGIGPRTLVTLGSPLGIRNLVFDLLDPPPQGGRGAWPGATERWANVADQGDVVALVKRLAPQFDDRVDDRLVNNGATAHNVKPYLTARETGEAIAAGLAA
jgi:hypothetical protein